MTVNGIIDSDMIAGAVGTEMMLHRCLGMTHGKVVEQRVAAILRSPEHHVEVHHVVHDGVVSAEHLHVAGPGEDGADHRVEECGERVGRSKDNLFVISIVCGLIAFTEGTEHQEADIMIEDRLIGDVSQSLRVAFGGLFDVLILRKAVVHPQDTGPESAAPLLSRCRPAVPAFLLVGSEDVTWLFTVVVGTIRLSQVLECTQDLRVAIVQLLVHVECLGRDKEWQES